MEALDVVQPDVILTGAAAGGLAYLTLYIISYAVRAVFRVMDK